MKHHQELRVRGFNSVLKRQKSFNHRLYFDKHHKFGVVRYHQDDFDELWTEHLENLLKVKESRANQNFEELLIQIIDKLEDEILEDKQEEY